MMLIYRVSNLDKAASELRLRGWREEKSLEIQIVLARHFVILQIMLSSCTKTDGHMLWKSSKDELIMIS
jgi:hypothetical protein